MATLPLKGRLFTWEWQLSATQKHFEADPYSNRVLHDSQTLWCHGMAGSGKSMFTYLVVDRLKGFGLGFAIPPPQVGVAKTPDDKRANSIRLKRGPASICQYDLRRAKRRNPTRNMHGRLLDMDKIAGLEPLRSMCE
jgi:hypothetical protein